MRFSIDQLWSSNVPISLVVLVVTFKIFRSMVSKWSGARLPQLKGPPSTNFFIGRLDEMGSTNTRDAGAIYARWASEYGPVFQIPTPLGGRCVILCDRKAIAHFFSKDTFTYIGSPSFKIFCKKFFGANIMYAENQDHLRQRRSLSPAFSNAALRVATCSFFEIANKESSLFAPENVKARWMQKFESSDEVVFDVQKWLNAITLDSIGLAGFGHNFKAVEDHDSAVNDVFRYFNDSSSNDIRLMIDIISPIFPFIFNVPTRTVRMFRKLNQAISKFAAELITKNSGKDDQSLLGLLMKGRSEGANFKEIHEELVSQINVILFAAHEGTTVSLTWMLIELARNPDKQCKLREELRQFSNRDPTYDGLAALPYLNAVAHESLRIHTTVEDILRVATEDDIIPLDTPIETASGQTIDSIVVPKGTRVAVPLVYLNTDENSWGPDAKKFVPERWLEENSNAPKQMYTFSEGPRQCVGRRFALAEVKTVLCVLIRNFSFELVDGPDTKLDLHYSLMAHPKMAGESGSVVPMRVRRVVK